LQGRPDPTRTLLGIELDRAGPPCAVDVPNLNTDRGSLLASDRRPLNMRRLMYQSLIWGCVGGDEACRLGAAFDSEGLQGTAHPLVDGVRRNAEASGNLLGREMLMDEVQAFELARTEALHAGGQLVIERRCPTVLTVLHQSPVSPVLVTAL
jgi:hypothetical protein